MLKPLPKVLKPSEKPLHELIKPGGKELGEIRKGAGPDIRTVTRSQFDRLKSEILDGSTEIPAPSGFNGKWFLRPDGSKISIRRSARNGDTIEVVESADKTLKSGYKVHFK